MHSQSLTARGVTQWIPYVVETITHPPEVMDVLNAKHDSVNRVVANMTSSHATACHSTHDLTTFFPHVGLFLSEFVVGTVLNAAIKKEKKT